MPRHFEKRILPYTPAQMFALVADVASYPDFLPWCKKAVLRDRGESSLTADLYVGAKGFQERFTSHVTLVRASRIQVTYGGGALARLSNEWTFVPAPNGGCEISFFVDFALRSKLLGVLMDAFFDVAFRRMVQSFEQRAKELYGVQSAQTH